MSGTYGAILAAGLGTRLRPLTLTCPKPKLPICGRPLLEYGMDLLESAALRGVGINAFHCAEAFESGFEARPFPIHVSHEDQLLGTGGGLKRIASLFPKGRFVSINGDALLDCDLGPIVKRHIDSGAVATMVLRPVPRNSPFARVGYDQQQRIYKISEVEAPDVDAHDLTFSAYTGVQIVEPELLELVDSGPCDVIRTGYRRALDQGLYVRAEFVHGLWLDVGTPERYFHANKHLAALSENDRRRWRVPASAPGMSARSWVHPQSSLGDGCMIGDGVVVNSPSILSGSIELRDFVGVGAIAIERSMTGFIGYETDGTTQYIELKSL